MSILIPVGGKAKAMSSGYIAKNGILVPISMGYVSQGQKSKSLWSAGELCKVYGGANETITFSDGSSCVTDSTGTGYAKLKMGVPITATGSISKYTCDAQTMIKGQENVYYAMRRYAIYWFGNECSWYTGGWSFPEQVSDSYNHSASGNSVLRDCYRTGSDVGSSANYRYKETNDIKLQAVANRWVAQTNNKFYYIASSTAQTNKAIPFEIFKNKYVYWYYNDSGSSSVSGSNGIYDRLILVRNTNGSLDLSDSQLWKRWDYLDSTNTGSRYGNINGSDYGEFTRSAYNSANRSDYDGNSHTRSDSAYVWFGLKAYSGYGKVGSTNANQKTYAVWFA